MVTLVDRRDLEACIAVLDRTNLYGKNPDLDAFFTPELRRGSKLFYPKVVFSR